MGSLGTSEEFPSVLNEGHPSTLKIADDAP